jgi:hypothetical protein
MKHFIGSSCPCCSYPIIILINDYEESSNACPRCHYAYSTAREFSQYRTPQDHQQAIWKYIFKLFKFNTIDDMHFVYVKQMNDYLNNGAPLNNISHILNKDANKYKHSININYSICTCDSLTLFRGCKCKKVS